MIAMADFSLLGIGFYTIPDASRYIRVPRSSLARWANGYTYKYDGEPREVGPILQAPHPELAAQRILTFLDVMELKAVGALREKWSLSLARIREAAVLACREWGVTHPFATRQFFTDGARLFHDRGPHAPGTLREVGRSQHVFEDVLRPFLTEIDYSLDGVAERYWPFGREGGVILDPARSFGQPIDEKTGIPTRVLYEMLAGGSSPKEVAWWYEVEVAAVLRAKEFEDSLRTK